MNPLLLIVPALGLIVVPRLWANRVLLEYDDEQPQGEPAHRVARALLDQHDLADVAVESTDRGDHYDPDARVVRLTHDHFDSTSLTAVTIAAHEVAHAIQHATGYSPFLLRSRLARVAQVAGWAGGAVLIAVPIGYLLTQRRLPPAIVSSAALAMIGTSAAAQFVAVPAEWNASFERALPMLKQGHIDDEQADSAHRILYACSMTYVAASLAGVLHIWPWLGRTRTGVGATAELTPLPGRPRHRRGQSGARGPGVGLRGSRFEATLRRVAKPLLRRWLLA